MGWLKRILKNEANISKEEKAFYNYFGSFNDETKTSAQRIATVYSCVNVLSESLASFPLKIYRNNSKGEKEEIRTSDLKFKNVKRVLSKPNSIDTYFDFFERIVSHLALCGNFFAFKIYGMGDRLVNLLPIFDPREVSVRVLDNWTYEFNYNGKAYTEKDIFYIKAHDGKSVLTYLSDTFDSAGAMTKYSKNFYQNYGMPTGVIESDKEMKSEAFKEFKKKWEDFYTGPKNAGKTVILDSGKKYKQISISNTDAQFLDTLKYTNEQICGIFRVPPHLVQILDHATFSNIEHQSLQFAYYTMQPWCNRIERAINDQILNPIDSDLYCEFLMDSLMRGDTTARFQAYNLAKYAGIMSSNEIRRKENLSPVDGGDKIWIPSNMRNGKDDPLFEKGDLANITTKTKNDTENNKGE